MSEDDLVNCLHNSPMPPLANRVLVSIEGDYMFITKGGGRGRVHNPTGSTTRASVRNNEYDDERLRSISSFSTMGSTIGGIVRSSCASNSIRQATFSTFTYSPKDASFQRAQRDTRLLVRRLKNRYTSLEYIRVLEPHETGDWHAHAVFLLPDGVEVSSANKAICDAWPYGRARSNAVTDADGLARYLSPFSEKKRVRWHFYPPKARTISVSLGMPRPREPVCLSEGEAHKMVASLGAQYIGERPFGPPEMNVGRKLIYRMQ